MLCRDGEVIGIAGYYLLLGAVLVFSEAKPGIPKMTIWRESLAFMADLKLPAICVAEETSGRFLERLGWHRATPDGDVYQWQPSSQL